MNTAVNAVPTSPVQRYTNKDAWPDSTHFIDAAQNVLLGTAIGKEKSQPARQHFDSIAFSPYIRVCISCVRRPLSCFTDVGQVSDDAGSLAVAAHQ